MSTLVHVHRCKAKLASLTFMIIMVVLDIAINQKIHLCSKESGFKTQHFNLQQKLVSLYHKFTNIPDKQMTVTMPLSKS